MQLGESVSLRELLTDVGVTRADLLGFGYIHRPYPLLFPLTFLSSFFPTSLSVTTSLPLSLAHWLRVVFVSMDMGIIYWNRGNLRETTSFITEGKGPSFWLLTASNSSEPFFYSWWSWWAWFCSGNHSFCQALSVMGKCCPGDSHPTALPQPSPLAVFPPLSCDAPGAMKRATDIPLSIQ